MQEVRKQLSNAKEFEEFEDYYFATNTGKIIIAEHTSIDKNGIQRIIKEKECKVSISPNGSNRVSLKIKNKRSTNRLVSYIVGVLFVSNPNNYNVIIHIDKNENNNNAENLQWITAINNPAYDTVVSLEKEEWKPILGFDMYQVSNMGRIKSIPRDVKVSDNTYQAKESFLLTPTIEERSGYCGVGLTFNSRIVTKRIHRIVAEAFIPNPNNKPQVDHIDQNKLNNMVSNLRWVTSKENNQNGGTSSVIVTFPDNKEVIFDSIIKASEATGYAPGSITRHCARRSKAINGYKFRWKDQQRKMGQQNKRKGNSFELEVVHKLNDIGFNVVTSRSESKRTDDNKIDIMDMDGSLPINIQTKYTSTTPNYFNIRSMCTDKSKPFSVIWKKSVSGENSPGTVAIIPVDFLYKMLEMFNKKSK